jgi:L-galactose dehydrogenase
MIYRPLGKTGVQVSVIGFGASPFGNEFQPVTFNDCQRAVNTAIDQGINFFDVAPYYGRTLAEERLGAALIGKREAVLLATKCGRYDRDLFDFSAERTFSSVNASLQRLRTDYLDFYQVHDVEFGAVRQIVDETLPALAELRRQGKVRFIGITGYSLSILQQIATEGNARQLAIDTILSYCRYNLLSDELDHSLRPFVEASGIGLINASPLHMGVLTVQGPPAWHPAAPEVLAAGKRAVDLLVQNGVNPSAFALRYCVDYPHAASTIVGMASAETVAANCRVLDTPLDPELLLAVKAAVADGFNKPWASGSPENSQYS